MATVKRRRKMKKTIPVKGRKRTKKAAAVSKKDGFPTVREMREARDEFAEEVGAKIIIASKAKEMIKAMGLRASAEFLEALANVVYLNTFKAAKRCVGNDRKTIRPIDL